MKYLYYHKNMSGLGLVIHDTNDVDIITDSTTKIGIQLTEEDVDTIEISENFISENNLEFLQTYTCMYKSPSQYILLSERNKLIHTDGETISLSNKISKYFIPNSDFTEWIPYLQSIRDKRNVLLFSSDWTQLPDSPLDSTAQLENAEYRQYLRDRPEEINETDPYVLTFSEWKEIYI